MFGLIKNRAVPRRSAKSTKKETTDQTGTKFDRAQKHEGILLVQNTRDNFIDDFFSKYKYYLALKII